jgi:hypothetical protein
VATLRKKASAATVSRDVSVMSVPEATKGRETELT